MVRTPGFHPGNRGFDSHRDHHLEFENTPQGVFLCEPKKLLTFFQLCAIMQIVLFGNDRRSCHEAEYSVGLAGRTLTGALYRQGKPDHKNFSSMVHG